MDSSRRSIATTDESVTMYLSFDTDADDTLASKWQSVIATQTSQFLDVKFDETLEEKLPKDKTVLKALIKNDGAKDQASPLRPFDNIILNKHNALCSTPTKNITLTDVRQNETVTDAENKENTQPDAENNTLSSTMDATAATVKINTFLNEANATIEDNSIQENNKTNNVYPLSADVILENITEVSNEEQSIHVPSPLATTQQNMNAETVTDVVNEVSELIVKAMKLTETHKQQSTQLPKLPPTGLPRPRRSFLPAASSATFKQRMSIVVKTTLNSPARKLPVSKTIARRSYLPIAKSGSISAVTNYRKSMLIRNTETSISGSAPLARKSTFDAPGSVKSKPKEVAAVKAKPKEVFGVKPKSKQIFDVKDKPKKIVDKPKELAEVIKCKMCSATFHTQSLLDMHMRTHIDTEQQVRNAKQCNRSNKCKFCDKSFALERALHIHLLQNCVKIPPAEKRKLQYTELNHVKKAQLPKLVVSSAVPSTSFNLRKSTLPEPNKELSPAANEDSGAIPMAPPSANRVLKAVAHTGVYRTPTKMVTCHICKQSFKSILDYTNHSLTVHSKNQNQENAHAPSAQN